MVALACIKLAVGDTKNADERNSALGLIRLLKTAEADYFHTNGKYATFAQLIKSTQLAQTATASQENLHAYFSLNIESASEPLPGFTLGLDVPADGATYKLSVGRPGNCWLGFRTDEKDAVYEDKTSDCTAEAITDAPAPWGPPDIDQAMLTPHADVPCPLEQVLEATSHRARELEDNLQKFTARELIEHLEISKNGKRRGSTSGVFNYVAEIFESDGGAYINEYRSQTSVPATPTHAPLADTGTAAYFVQRTDHANDFRAYRIDNRLYPVNIKGRAWVAADSFEVLRLESDLVDPIREINLQKEHLTIEYAPVAFPKKDVRLWLPDNVTLYIEYRGHRYERRHSFSGFQLFSVDTVQKTKEPLLDKDAQTKKD
jgi:hypothetical protein